MSSRTYVGTKAFALKGSLLDSVTVQKLAEASSLEELVNRLRGSPYADVMSALSAPYTAKQIELALRERLAVVHRSITQGAGRYAILQLYYLRNVAWDVKIALKAKALNRTYEETVEYLNMKAEGLIGRRDLMIRVLTAKDIGEAVAMLSGTEFSQDVEKALASYSSTGEVRFFDLYVDRAVLSAISREYSLNSRLYAARSSRPKGVGDMVALDVDSYNAVGVLRAKLWGLKESDIQELMVAPTRRASHTLLSGMAAAESVSESIKLLEPVYRFPTAGAQSDEESIDMVEDAFAKELHRTAELAFVWQGLSAGTILALIKLLEFEVSNLSAIAIGVEAGMEPKAIMAKLAV